MDQMQQDSYCRHMELALAVAVVENRRRSLQDIVVANSHAAVVAAGEAVHSRCTAVAAARTQSHSL